MVRKAEADPHAAAEGAVAADGAGVQGAAGLGSLLVDGIVECALDGLQELLVGVDGLVVQRDEEAVGCWVGGVGLGAEIAAAVEDAGGGGEG